MGWGSLILRLKNRLFFTCNGPRTYVRSSGIFFIISGSGPSINDVTRITELLIAPYPHVIPFPIFNSMRHCCFLKFLGLKDGDIIYKRPPLVQTVPSDIVTWPNDESKPDVGQGTQVKQQSRRNRRARLSK